MKYQEGRKRILESLFCAEIKSVLRSFGPERWPDCDDLNAYLATRNENFLNSSGMPINFVPQLVKPKRFSSGFVQRTFLKGEVLVRPQNWHDLMNALVWMVFPRTKAALNARHFNTLLKDMNAKRSPEGDALTIFDEDGVFVITDEPNLIQLLEGFEWTELFYNRRDEVRSRLKCIIFGHALYEKSISPYVGMTGKAITTVTCHEHLSLSSTKWLLWLDETMSSLVANNSLFKTGRSFAPFPILGVPGWHKNNDRPEFYLDSSYFRKGRRPSTRA